MALERPRSSEDFALVWSNHSRARGSSSHPVTFPFVLGNLASRQVSSGCGSEVTYRVGWQIPAIISRPNTLGRKKHVHEELPPFRLVVPAVSNILGDGALAPSASFAIRSSDVTGG